MSMQRNYKFRIYPTKAQEIEMRRHLWVEKNLWNMLLEANKKKYAGEKKSLSTATSTLHVIYS